MKPVWDAKDDFSFLSWTLLAWSMCLYGGMDAPARLN